MAEYILLVLVSALVYHHLWFFWRLQIGNMLSDSHSSSSLGTFDELPRIWLNEVGISSVSRLQWVESTWIQWYTFSRWNSLSNQLFLNSDQIYGSEYWIKGSILQLAKMTLSLNLPWTSTLSYWKSFVCTVADQRRQTVHVCVVARPMGKATGVWGGR